jgi:hypothetical protein
MMKTSIKSGEGRRPPVALSVNFEGPLKYGDPAFSDLVTRIRYRTKSRKPVYIPTSDQLAVRAQEWFIKISKPQQAVGWVALATHQ